MVRQVTIEDMLSQGYIKVGSKSYCTYWKKGDEVVTVQDITYKDSAISDAYNKGYEDALRSIKINLEHFLKDVYSVEMIYEGCDIDRYEGESECSKFIKKQVLGFGDQHK